MPSVLRTKSPRTVTEHGMSNGGVVRLTTFDDAEASGSNVHNESDDDIDESDDEGVQALLRPDGYVRELERSEGVRGVWSMTKGIVLETAPTLLFTTIGLLFTGELLDHISHWRAMKRVDELIIIIPVILNLKGNLEMNLSARLGTLANLGELDERKSRYRILLGNMALLQVQAILVSFIASCLSFVLGLVLPRPAAEAAEGVLVTEVSRLVSRRPRPSPPGSSTKPPSGLPEFIMTAATAMCSASLSSALLGTFMCTLVVICRRFNLNPDNIAPPIAACLGDLITLCLLGVTATVLAGFIDTPMPLIVVILLSLCAIMCLYFTRRNPSVRYLITQGWTPLFGAMAISTATGIILDLFVSRYNGFALLSVIISGLPGAAGSIFVSRLSTSLHARALTGPARKAEPVPPEPSIHLVVITLFLITLPIEIICLIFLRGIGWLQLPILFIVFSIIFFCAAVAVSLLIARLLTAYLWSKGLDPDTYAMPIHSSTVDLVGQSLLVACFEVVMLLGGKVKGAQ